VSCRGGTQIIGQQVQVGPRYAGQIVTIEVDDTTLHVYDERDHLIKNVPPHQPQGDPPTQGLRSHHQPPNRLGTVTHHLKPNGTHHLNPDTKCSKCLKLYSKYSPPEMLKMLDLLTPNDG
jgi:hypothetical protein